MEQSDEGKEFSEQGHNFMMEEQEKVKISERLVRSYFLIHPQGSVDEILEFGEREGILKRENQEDFVKFQFLVQLSLIKLSKAKRLSGDLITTKIYSLVETK
jgi:hypothetical protein